MGNQYGITALESSTPSQDTIDGFLNWCDANPPDVDIEGITQEAAEKIKDQLVELKNTIADKTKELVETPLAYLQDQKSILLDIIDPPEADPSAIVTWINKLITYLKKPYEPIVAAVKWWPTFAAAATDAASGTISRCEEQISKVDTVLATATSSVV